MTWAIQIDSVFFAGFNPDGGHLASHREQDAMIFPSKRLAEQFIARNGLTLQAVAVLLAD